MAIKACKLEGLRICMRARKVEIEDAQLQLQQQHGSLSPSVAIPVIILFHKCTHFTVQPIWCAALYSTAHTVYALQSVFKSTLTPPPKKHTLKTS